MGRAPISYLAAVGTLTSLPLVVEARWLNACWALVVFIATAVVLRTSSRGDQANRRAWFLLGVGMFFWGVGEVTWHWLAVRQDDVPFPSWADVGYLGAVPFLAASLHHFGRSDLRSPYRLRTLDLAAICVGAGCAIWTLVGPESSTTLGTTELVMLLAYPTSDMLLVGMAAFAVMSAGRTTQLSLIVCGITCFVVADIAFAHLMQHEEFELGGTISVLWPIGFAMMGLAALLPVGRVPEALRARQSRALPVLLLLSSLAVPLSAALELHADQPVNVPLLIGSATLMSILVLARMSLLQLDLEQAWAELGAAHERMERSNTLRGQLLKRMDHLLEQGRKQVATELHDGPLQELAAGMYRIEAEAARSQPDAARIACIAVEGIRAEIDSIRRIMSSLRPPALDDRGLGPAVNDLAAELRGRSGAAVDVQVELAHPVPADVDAIVYRMVQECFVNIRSHANARAVDVSIASDDLGTSIVIADDGAGFDDDCLALAQAEGRFGLAAMRERIELTGGTWRLLSAPGSGVRIEARIPHRGARASEWVPA